MTGNVACFGAEVPDLKVETRRSSTETIAVPIDAVFIILTLQIRRAPRMKHRRQCQALAHPPDHPRRFRHLAENHHIWTYSGPWGIDPPRLQE